MTNLRRPIREAISATVALCMLGCSRTAANADEAKPATQVILPMQIGINLGNPTYWSSEWPYNDIVQSTGALLTGNWGKLNADIELDDRGRPIHVPKGSRFVAVIQQGSPRLPIGDYRCDISEGWDARPFGDWVMNKHGASFDMRISQPVSSKGVSILLSSNYENASLRELSCLPISGNTNKFREDFIGDNEPYSVIRFMDWMKTNNAPYRVWARRARADSFSQAGPEGASLEDMIDAAVALKADPWFCMPMDADNDYYREFAISARDHLPGNRKIYVELSNEVWNVGFSQGRDAVQRGMLRYPGKNAGEAADLYYSDRVRELMKIWNEVFKDQPNRIVRVFATQAVNPARAEPALRHLDTFRYVDALATAPYFGTTGLEIPLSGKAKIDYIFARGSEYVDKAISDAKKGRGVAASFHLRYISYEGGPGFQAYVGQARSDMIALNKDQRMYGLYRTYLRRWKDEIGGLLVLYTSVAGPSIGGNFGNREYTGQALADAPKARAIADFARTLPTDNSASR